MLYRCFKSIAQRDLVGEYAAVHQLHRVVGAGLLVPHVEHLVARPQELLRRAMAVQAPLHLQRVRLRTSAASCRPVRGSWRSPRPCSRECCDRNKRSRADSSPASTPATCRCDSSRGPAPAWARWSRSANGSSCRSWWEECRRSWSSPPRCGSSGNRCHRPATWCWWLNGTGCAWATS